MNHLVFILYIALPLCYVYIVHGQFPVSIGGCFIDGNLSPYVKLSNAVKFCEGKENHLIFGKFVDGFKIMCHHDFTGELALFNFGSARLVKLERTFCKEGKLLTGDINGDQINDLVCHWSDGSIKYMLNDNMGRFESSIIQSIGEEFCRGDGNSTVHLGDLNDDGLADLVCYNNKGNVSYAFSESQSFGSVIYLEYPLCEIDGGEFLIGDFNGDGRTDAICHPHTDDVTSIFLSTEDRVFVEPAWSKKLNYCKEKDSFLLAADVNGDRCDDLICKDTTSFGLTTIIRNIQPGLYFINANPQFNFCSNSGKRTFIKAYLDDDNRNDLMCQTRKGTRVVLLSRCYI